MVHPGEARAACSRRPEGAATDQPKALPRAGMFRPLCGKESVLRRLSHRDYCSPDCVVFITIRDDYSNQTRQYAATAEVWVAELLDVMTHAVGQR